jgi:hypothetical protein
MSTTETRPFTAATSKLAYAQAFAGPGVRRRNPASGSQLRLGRRFAILRRPRRG